MSRSAVPRDPAVTSRIMASVHSKDSRPELALRKGLHALGVRYRLHAAEVMGRPDLVIRKYKIAIFVDGDMWHGNAWRLRGKPDLASLFPTRTEWWTNKIQTNMARDRTVNLALTEAGWRVVRIWESTILRSTADAAELIATEVASLKAASRAYPPGSLIHLDL
ncbi:MAG TPA: very short patch repair endonuclease [Candidatus Dormibacteraeota bacterium]|nr:very short patch repair endonuclease [Candidatus Dormibacteraeota bacterium]